MEEQKQQQDEPTNHGILDWITYGILWRERLVSQCAIDDVVSTVFEPTSAYDVQFLQTGRPGVGDPIVKIMTDPAVSCIAKWDILKKYAAAIRYSFLSGTFVGSVSVDINPESPLASRIILKTPGADIVISGSNGFTSRRNNGQVLLQGGHPALWFDTNRWRQHRPATEEGVSSASYPLSLPSYCESRYDPALRRIGALHVHRSFWAPPIGTANDDMHEYVRCMTGQGSDAA